MRNPERTKQIILQQAAMLFNTQGYKATSISDITNATGFTKGAIYKHFENKEKLEVCAMEYMAQEMQRGFKQAVQSQHNFKDKMIAILDYFKGYTHQPTFAGGCVLLNAAIETDDRPGVLRDATARLLYDLESSIIHLIAKGIQYKQIPPSTDAKTWTTYFIATIEGGIMVSKLKQSATPLRIVLNKLKEDINQLILIE